MIIPMTRALIFDCFGVLYTDPIPTYISDPQTSPAQAAALRSLHERALRGVLSKAGFVAAAALLLRCQPEEIEQRFFRGLVRNMPLINFTQAARKTYKIALLSNIESDVLSGYFNATDLEQLFDAVIISGDLKVSKPDPAIFELACKRLGVAPSEAVMVDDAPENVNSAITIGMQGIVYENFAQFTADIQQYTKAS